MEIGTGPEIRNAMQEETKTTEKLQQLQNFNKDLWKSLPLLCQFLYSNEPWKAGRKHDFLSHERK